MKGLVTSRRAVAAASCVASLATRVLRWTCMPRYRTDNTTAIELTSCDTALIASQFMSRVIPQANRWLLLRLVGDFEHNLSARVMRRGLLLRLHCFGKWQHLRDDRLDLFLFDQLADLRELARVGLDRDRRSADPVFVELRLLGLRDQRCDDSALPHYPVRTRERVLPNRVEHHVDILGDVFEFRFRVIDRFICAELLEQLLVCG